VYDTMSEAAKARDHRERQPLRRYPAPQEVQRDPTEQRRFAHAVERRIVERPEGRGHVGPARHATVQQVEYAGHEQ